MYLLVLAFSLLLATVTSIPYIDPSIHPTLRKEGVVNLIVTMKSGTERILETTDEQVFTSRGAMIQDMVDRLSAHAQESQKALTRLFAEEEAISTPRFIHTKSFWVSNQVFVQAASSEMVQQLAEIPSILEIRRELVLSIPRTFPSHANTSSAAIEWGVEKIQAPAVWEHGNTGTGVIVATIDTGVLGTHEALKKNFRGSYGWFDPESKKSAPYDGNGHGTHTMGTIAGANGIGVAPGSTWMACKGCRTDQCPESDLLACAEFITCPTDTDGKNKDCSKAPHVVSNSWGGGQGDTFFKSAVDAWRKAGIIPIFANGNSGPDCTTANSPGDYDNVIAVGATDSNDAIASFSSRGPAKSGIIKPDISSPGVNIRSSWNSNNASYNSISGTSMATPHVAGVVALLLASKPGLTYDQVRKALVGSADTSTLVSDTTCGSTSNGTYPDNIYGAGRTNVWKAIEH